MKSGILFYSISNFRCSDDLKKKVEQLSKKCSELEEGIQNYENEGKSLEEEIGNAQKGLSKINNDIENSFVMKKLNSEKKPIKNLETMTKNTKTNFLSISNTKVKRKYEEIIEENLGDSESENNYGKEKLEFKKWKKPRYEE